ncbi:hypothetical protein JOM49_002510 [Amycolatopsis magusensis]|uniref:Transposase n=1 Tax=Amycolatopsis magusensis TaxID=882444 RepID=A0ABS4PQ37_9PSEU|nr:hypothetical protein [Amycolatopsis magusensis]
MVVLWAMCGVRRSAEVVKMLLLRVMDGENRKVQEFPL